MTNIQPVGYHGLEGYNLLYIQTMQCPYCNSLENKVTNKRLSPQGIRRRRECLNCKERFTTYEKIEISDLYVIKKDGRREKFSREKLEIGIDKAFEKRPISKEIIRKMTLLDLKVEVSIREA